MIWVVGTGRCGMQNFTSWFGGFIESDQKLRDLAVDRYHQDYRTDHPKMDFARARFLERSLLPAISVADCTQFMFIDLIREVDPYARFIWIKREREACVSSFMDRHGEDQRIHPLGWVFRHETKRELMEWYYDEVNRIIEHKLKGALFAQIKTEDMPQLFKK